MHKTHCHFIRRIALHADDDEHSDRICQATFGFSGDVVRARKADWARLREQRINDNRIWREYHDNVDTWKKAMDIIWEVDKKLLEPRLEELVDFIRERRHLAEKNKDQDKCTD